MMVDPRNPERTRDLLYVIYPDSNHTEGIVLSSKRATHLWGGQAAGPGQDGQNKTQPV